MENIPGWQRSEVCNSDFSKRLGSKPEISYMLLCELLKMDLFCQNDPDPMSVMDMLDDRNDLDSLFLNSDRDCGLDPKLEPISRPSILPEMDDMDTVVSQSDAFGEIDWLQGLQSAALSQIQNLSETENTDPNLLVNPQTVIPINLHPMHVRDAMLTGNSINLVIPTTSSIDSLQSPNITGHSGFSLTNHGINKMLLSPSECSPVLVGHLQNGRAHVTVNLPVTNLVVTTPKKKVAIETTIGERQYPKPMFSYSCLIALALKNSPNGSLPVSEIYSFMTENFPYFKTAPDGWKNSVRHNLSLNKCFEKVENPKLSSNAKKGCLWALNPLKKEKMEEEIAKGSKKDPSALRCSMAFPDNLGKIERGEAGLHFAKSLRLSKPVEPITPSKPLEHIPLTMSHTPTLIKTEDLFSSDLRDINVLDSNFPLEPSLSLAMQHSLWDDDLSADLNLDLHPHITMATVGSPMLSGCSTSSDPYPGFIRAAYHGTCVYASSPAAELQNTNSAAFTAALLSMTSPNRTISVAKT